MTRNSLIAGWTCVVSAGLIALAIRLGPVFGAAVALLAPMPIASQASAGAGPSPLSVARWQASSCSALQGGSNALAVALTLMAPMVVLTYLAQLCRFKDKPTPFAPDEIEWYPAGHLVFWAAVAAGITPLAVLLILHLDLDTLARCSRSSSSNPAKAVETGAPVPGAPPRPLGPEEIKAFTETAISVFPAALAVSNFLTVIFSLWLAGRAALSAGALSRPWPDIAFFDLPRIAPLALAAALLATMTSNEYVTLFGTALGGSLFFVYLLLGLAVIHAISRGQAWRPYALVVLYAALLVLNISPWPASSWCCSVSWSRCSTSGPGGPVPTLKSDFELDRKGDYPCRSFCFSASAASARWRCRQRQGRLCTQLPPAAEEGSARHEGKPRPVRDQRAQLEANNLETQEGSRSHRRNSTARCSRPSARRVIPASSTARSRRAISPTPLRLAASPSTAAR